jgi:hypothetical protein
LDVIVIFGEGGINLGLHGGRVLSRLQELILQRFIPEHRVAEALQHARLLSNEYSTIED